MKLPYENTLQVYNAWVAGKPCKPRGRDVIWTDGESIFSRVYVIGCLDALGRPVLHDGHGVADEGVRRQIRSLLATPIWKAGATYHSILATARWLLLRAILANVHPGHDHHAWTPAGRAVTDATKACAGDRERWIKLQNATSAALSTQSKETFHEKIKALEASIDKALRPVVDAMSRVSRGGLLAASISSDEALKAVEWLSKPDLRVMGLHASTLDVPGNSYQLSRAFSQFWHETNNPTDNEEPPF